MIISANIDNILDALPCGVIILDMKNNINKVNRFMQNQLRDHSQVFSNLDITEVLQNPIVEQVKETHQQTEKKDYLLPAKREVITTYQPLLNKQETLDGVMIVIELFSAFNKRTNKYTDYEKYQQILSMVKEEKREVFRVVTGDGDIWFETNAWNEEWYSLNHDIKSRIEYITKQTITDRRKIKETFLAEKENIHTTRELISKPLLVNGKLIGSIQFSHLKVEEYYKNELEQMKKIVRFLEKTYDLEDLIGTGSEMKLALNQAKLYKDMKTPILIIGEKGTGKTTLARAIHMDSKRKSHPFITVNSRSLKEKNGMEDALKYIQKKALNGTVFVRIEASMPAHIQKKLRHLVHACTAIRFIFGVTSPPEGKKWDDEMNRMIQRYQIMLPPLHQRTEDISYIAAELVYYYNQKYHKNISEIDESLIRYWGNKQWPNNIYQLDHEIETLISDCDALTKMLSIHQLSDTSTEEAITSIPTDHMSLQQALEQFEKDYIYKALQHNDNNKTKTAHSLHISVRSLYYKMEKYKMGRGGT